MTKQKSNLSPKVKFNQFILNFNKFKSGVTIKTKQGNTKFKLRCPRYLYTLKINDQGKADKIKSSIPSCINKKIYSIN